jgi:hypothetical protein
MKVQTDAFIKVFNDAFKSPFLPEGFAVASSRSKGHGKGLKLRIGDVDVEVDGKGHIVAHGSNVKAGRKWDIAKRV